MGLFYDWRLNQVQEIDFVLVDATNAEVAGLGAAFTLELRKIGGAFVGSTGTKAEISNGWYRYTNVAAEADTLGGVAIRVTGAGIIQQNLLAVVELLTPNAIEFTYTITSTATGFPIEGVLVWITTDITGNNIIWSGNTDAFGIARDANGQLPFLDAGTYYFWRQRSGFTFTNPDIEIVS